MNNENYAINLYDTAKLLSREFGLTEIERNNLMIATDYLYISVMYPRSIVEKEEDPELVAYRKALELIFANFSLSDLSTEYDI